jgi:hypothetical protein
METLYNATLTSNKITYINYRRKKENALASPLHKDERVTMSIFSLKRPKMGGRYTVNH